MVPSRLSVDEDATWAENFPSLVFDPFRKVCGQGCTPGGQTVVVISPVSNLAVISTYDRDSSDRNRNPSGESSVERLGNSDLKCPLRDHMLVAHERLVGLQKAIWIKLPCFRKNSVKRSLSLNSNPMP